MKNPPAIREASASEMEALMAELDKHDIESVETYLQAHAVTRECQRQLEEERRKDQIEQIGTEVGELVASVTAGAISTYKSAASFQTGAAINYVVGAAAKIGSGAFAARMPENIKPAARVARAACRVGKTLLHTQMGIFTRRLIEEKP